MRAESAEDPGRPEVVSLGEPLVQLSPPSGRRLQSTGTLEVHTAGAEMNVAVGLARLGHRSAFVGRVGRTPSVRASSTSSGRRGWTCPG